MRDQDTAKLETAIGRLVIAVAALIAAMLLAALTWCLLA